MTTSVTLSQAALDLSGTPDSSKVLLVIDAQYGSCLIHNSNTVGQIVGVSTVFFDPSYQVSLRLNPPPAGNTWGAGGSELDLSGAQLRGAAAVADFETIPNTQLTITFIEVPE